MSAESKLLITALHLPLQPMKASRLAETFSVSLFTGNLALLVLRGRVDPTKHTNRFPLTNRWIGSCYHYPRTQEIKLEALNELLGGYGVECIRLEDSWDTFYGDCVASYINLGDTYTPTLLLDHQQNRWRLTDWGSWYEAAEQRRGTA